MQRAIDRAYSELNALVRARVIIPAPPAPPPRSLASATGSASRLLDLPPGRNEGGPEAHGAVPGRRRILDAIRRPAAQAATSEPHLEEAGVDASEEISMEEVLGPGTHKKPVVNEEAELPKVESQTV